MKGKYALKCLGFAILFLAAIGAMGFIVMHLWNWLMPAIFGLKLISYCEAFGLLILSKILFGGFRSKWGRHCSSCCQGGRGNWRSRWEEKWSTMSPEERARIKKGFGNRCSTWGQEKSSDKD
jgi:hypothetical protein